MLVLTRKIGEAVIVSDNIVIKLLGIRGQQIRLGIEAPESIVVDREEVYMKKKAQRKKDPQLFQVVVTAPVTEE